MLINIVDVEASCWDGPPPDGQLNEIIEIGICALDTATLTVTLAASLMVRPELSQLSPFCTELTGIGVDEAAGGMRFGEACKQLTDEFDTTCRTWLSWGDYDRKQFLRDCTHKQIAYPFGPHHINGKELHARLNGLKRQPGMAQVLKDYGMPLEGRHHRGGDDAANIARIIVRLICDHGAAILNEQTSP